MSEEGGKGGQGGKGGEGESKSENAESRPRKTGDEPLGDLAEEVRNRAGGEISSGGGGRGIAGDSTDGSQRDGPLADVASVVDERRRRKREGDSDAFESVDVGELDGEQLWEQLATDDEVDGPVVTVPPEEAVPAEGPEWDSDDRDVRTIPKDTCHGCPHFGDPPELACTHEGTDILAMTDSEHFRVADCPMVEDDDEEISAFADEDLEDGDEDGGEDGESVADGESLEDGEDVADGENVEVANEEFEEVKDADADSDETDLDAGIFEGFGDEDSADDAE